ncbi:glutaredoxin family protein [Beggiatoa alba]|nr:glutaredoxin family protein [Beggiatoa alba]
MEKRELEVFTRAGCHLCEALIAELSEYCDNRPFSFKIIEISGDAVLEQRYGLKVPVVAYGKNTLCEYFLDTQAIEVYFGLAGN